MVLRRISDCGISLLVIVLGAVTTNVLGQEGQTVLATSAAAELAPLPQVTNQPQMAAADRPTTPQYLPPDYSALPPAGGAYDADLAKRVADLEKQLANYAKAAESGKPKASAKPLIAPSGRIQFEVANFSQNAESVEQFKNAKNTVGFRRARLALLGEYEVIDYLIEMDFANRGINSVINSKDQSTAFKEVYIQVRELPWLGNVRVGHFKECFGLEQLTSDNYTTFMERSVADEGALVPGRNNGIMAFNWTENQRATWAIGTFTNQTGFDQPPTFIYDHWGLDLTMRGTYLPWYDEPSGGRGLLHTGIDYSYRSAPDGLATFASRPESAFAPSIVNFTLNDVNQWQVFGLEAAAVYGPLSVQSEVFAATVERQKDVNNNFYGCYAYVSYFLTGENRPYNRKLGVFDRIRPYENFFRVRTADGCTATGHGAWEVAYRFSTVNLLDNLTVTGAGLATDHTIGLNWYLNPFTRLQFNYVHSNDTFNQAANNRVSGGNLDIFEMRFAMDF
jgi:phosphate-selective porin OprO and OprP